MALNSTHMTNIMVFKIAVNIGAPVTWSLFVLWLSAMAERKVRAWHRVNTTSGLVEQNHDIISPIEYHI